MPRDEELGKKKELWNVFSVVPNQDYDQKKEEGERKMWTLLLLPK